MRGWKLMHEAKRCLNSSCDQQFKRQMRGKVAENGWTCFERFGTENAMKKIHEK